MYLSVAFKSAIFSASSICNNGLSLIYFASAASVAKGVIFFVTLTAGAMVRAAFAASCNAATLISSEYAKPVFSPLIARTPTPRSML